MTPTNPEPQRRALRRRWYQWMVLGLAALVSLAAVGLAILLFQTNRSANSLGRIDVGSALAVPSDDATATTVLLMGFESGSTLGQSDALRSPALDAQREAEMIWLLHLDHEAQSLSVLSIAPQTALSLTAQPVGGLRAPTSQVAAAHVTSLAGVGGAIEAVEATLGVDIHHYAEMDVADLASLVDAIGGVPIYVPYPLRDLESGFQAATQGCVTFDGETVQRYLRSDTLEGQNEGGWAEVAGQPGQAPIDRERDLLTALIRQLPVGIGQPISGYRFWSATADAVSVDTSLSRGDLVNQLSDAQDYQRRQLLAFTLPLDQAAAVGGVEPLQAGSVTDGILAHFRSSAAAEANPMLAAGRDQALQPGMTGLRSITCRR